MYEEGEIIMPNTKNMTAAQKAMARERIIKKAAGMTPAARKKYIASLKAKGISPATIGQRTNKKKTLKQSYFGSKKKK
jgi:hypothetical protein